MRKFTQQTFARLFVTVVILAGVAMASEYLSRNPPEPGTLLGQVWAIVSR